MLDLVKKIGLIVNRLICIWSQYFYHPGDTAWVLNMVFFVENGADLLMDLL